MAKNNFDDFLLDPSFDDLDNIHQEAERQLFKDGGTRADRRIKKAVNKGKLEKAARISKRAGNREARKAYRKQERSLKKGPVTGKIKRGPLTKAIKDTSELSKDNKSNVKVANSSNLNKGKGDKEHKAPQGATNAPGKTKTKRGTGVTYEDAWRANKNGVKSKYANYAAFKKAAQQWNKDNPVKKKKPVKTDSKSTRT